MKTLKNKLKNKELTIGSWLQIGDPFVAEIMAQSGFEWLTVDMQHSAIALPQAQKLIQVIDLYGIPPLVRVSDNEPVLIQRIMDAGAHGVIVPMVNTKDDAEKAVQSVRYAPEGKRGVGLWRAQGYGATFDQYKEWLSTESVVIVQIEHIDAVNNIEEILSVEGVDAFLVGPYDLSGSLGVPGQFDHPDVVAALDKIKTKSKAMNVAAGYHIVPPQAALVQAKIDEGYTFIVYSTDFIFIQSKCKESLDQLKRAQSA